MKLRFDDSSRTSLTGLSVNAMFIFTLMNPVGSILGSRKEAQVSSTSVISTPTYPLLWHAICLRPRGNGINGLVASCPHRTINHRKTG